MSHVIVNDASCLIDLKKAKLVDSLLKLPYNFLVPLPIATDELLDFTIEEWSMLEALGLKSFDLSGEQILDAVSLRTKHQGLSAYDCFALVTSEAHENSILLTGDGLLKKIAISREVRAHGVLWVYDQLQVHEICTTHELRFALETWKLDRTVFLPNQLIDERLRKLGN